MSRKRIVPTKPRFALAVRRAYEVLAKIGACELPVDPFRIGDYFPEIKIVAYTELRNNTSCKDPLKFDERNARAAFLEFFSSVASDTRIDAETHKMRGDKDYLVVYDDRIGSERRIRWTIAHELGHIFIGHLVEFTKTAIMRGGFGEEERGGLTEDEYGVLEVEANYFAAAFLAPATVVKKLSVCKNGEGIRDICDISDDAAYKRATELKRLPYSSYKIEETLNRNFYKYIRKTNNPDAEAFVPSLDGLSVMYEDYAEYEHWDYIVGSIGSKEKNAELCAALTSSIAIYDEGDMLIITEHERVKAIADEHSETILRCIKKYGMPSIETVSSVSAEALELLS